MSKKRNRSIPYAYTGDVLWCSKCSITLGRLRVDVHTSDVISEKSFAWLHPHMDTSKGTMIKCYKCDDDWGVMLKPGF